MEVLKALLSFLSYLFHGFLCLILIALSGLAMAAGAQTLQLGMLPWTGSTLLYTLFFGALFGLLTVILAITGQTPPLVFCMEPGGDAAAGEGLHFQRLPFHPWRVSLGPLPDCRIGSCAVGRVGPNVPRGAAAGVKRVLKTDSGFSKTDILGRTGRSGKSGKANGSPKEAARLRWKANCTEAKVQLQDKMSYLRNVLAVALLVSGSTAFAQSSEVRVSPSSEVSIQSPPPPKYFGPILKPFHLERRVVAAPQAEQLAAVGIAGARRKSLSFGTGCDRAGAGEQPGYRGAALQPLSGARGSAARGGRRLPAPGGYAGGRGSEFA